VRGCDTIRYFVRSECSLVLLAVITLSLKDLSEGQVWRERHKRFSHDWYQMHSLTQKAGLAVERVRNWIGEQFSPSVGTHVYVIGKQKA
jgi:hypothetical protein